MPRSPWERFVSTVGRGNTIFLLIISVFLLLVCALVAMDLHRDKSDTIAPAVALANGGHTVRVVAQFPRGSGLEWGDYSVVTLSGRPPSTSKGELASSAVQIVVGSDWIGQIRIHKDGQCDHFWNTYHIENTTDLIGEPYGWQDPTIVLPYPC